MLRGPQHIEAELIHGLRDVARAEEGLAQPLVRIAPLVGRRAVHADIVELDLPDIEHVEFVDHVSTPDLLGRSVSLLQNARRGYKRVSHVHPDFMPDFTPHQDAALNTVANWLKD